MIALDRVQETLEASRAAGAFPGAVALVRRHGEVLLHEAVGDAWVEPERRPMAPDTVFDLASLTKPLATTPVVLTLVERGLLDLDAPAGQYLPDLAGRDELTLRRLLTHTSGIRAWYPTYAMARTPVEVLRTISSLPLSAPPDTRVEYSCLGFIILGIVAERVAGAPLDRLAADLVFRPLGLREIGYRPGVPPHRYAATERGNDYEKGSVAGVRAQFDDWRTDYVPGAVHDGNAYYGMGGVSGNAGLFGTAADVAVLGQLWLNGGEYGGVRLLSPEMVALATSNLTPGLGDARGLGWKLKDPYSGEGLRSYGSLLSDRTFGHTGFTGTCLWVDPNDELVVVLLTNSIHPHVPPDDRIIAARGRFHDAVVQALA
jgi:CubicO group peptidase (beta-lactamase class C family)